MIHEMTDEDLQINNENFHYNLQVCLQVICVKVVKKYSNKLPFWTVILTVSLNPFIYQTATGLFLFR